MKVIKSLILSLFMLPIALFPSADPGLPTIEPDTLNKLQFLGIPVKDLLGKRIFTWTHVDKKTGSEYRQGEETELINGWTRIPRNSSQRLQDNEIVLATEKSSTGFVIGVVVQYSGNKDHWNQYVVQVSADKSIIAVEGQIMRLVTPLATSDISDKKAND